MLTCAKESEGTTCKAEINILKNAIEFNKTTALLEVNSVVAVIHYNAGNVIQQCLLIKLIWESTCFLWLNKFCCV